MKRAVERFREHRGRDNAAMLAFYTILSIAPSFLAAYSIARLAMANDEQAAISVLESAIQNYLPEEFEGDVQALAQSMWESAGWGIPGLLIVTAIALWSASTYVRGFSRVANDMYETEESRSQLVLWGIQVLLTLVILASTSGILIMLTANPEILGLIGSQDGLMATIEPIWQWLRWPIIIVVVVVLVTLLYRISPDINHDGKRGFSIGGAVAVVGSLIVWGLLSLYIQFFNVEGIYGAAGYIMALCFALWAINMVMVFGLAVDVERKRRGHDF